MSNFILNFLKGSVQPFIGTGEDVSNTIGNAEVNLAKHFGIKANTGVQTNQQQFGSMHLGPLGDMTQENTPRNFASNVAQVGLDVAAPAIGKGVTSFAKPVIGGAMDVGSSIAGRAGAKVVGGAVKGAIEAPTIGGAQAVAQGIGGDEPITPGKLTMDFLQGAVQSVPQGAVFGAAGGISGKTPIHATDSVGGLPSAILRQATKGIRTGLLDDETAAEAAKSESPKAIEKKLEPAVGPTVAHDVAQAASQTKDPHVIQRLVENDLAKKLPNPEPATPSPEEMQSIDQQGAATTDREQGKYMAEPGFMNAPGENQPTHVGTAGALSEAQEVLNSGGTVDEALNKYMESTGTDYGTAKDAIGKMIRESSPESLLRKNINAKLNPELERAKSILPDVQAGDKDAAVLNPKVVHNELNRLASAAAEAGSGLNDSDRELMETIHGKTLKDLLPQAQDKQAFTQAFNTLKKYDDTAQALAAQHLDVEVPYRQNHGLTMRWDNSPEEVKAAEVKKAALSKQPGWSKGRKIANYQEGEALGLKRANDNIYQDLQQDLQSKQGHLGQLSLQKGLEQAYGKDSVKVGEIGQKPGESPYKQLQIPYGQKLSMPSAIADELNRRAPPPEATGGWKTYDAFNGAWKNLKLGGGGFHGLNTTLSWLGQQIGSGNIFKHPEDTAGVFRSLFDKKFVEQRVQEWHSSGATLREDQLGLNASYNAAEGDIQSGKVGKIDLGNIPVLKQIHQSIFGRQIPFMMKSMFHQETDHLDLNDPAQRAEGIKVAKQINQQFGAFNRDIQGVTERTAKLAGRGVLAWDWNEGQVRTLMDAISKGGTEGKLARQTVFGKALLVAGIATALGTAGGEFKGKDAKQVAVDILQKTVNPSFQFGNYTVGLPTTQLSEIGKPAVQTIQNAMSGKSIANPFKDMASARLAAIPSGVEQIAGNRNFSGQPIAGTDYYGRPISPSRTAANIAGMVSPIPVTQGIQTASGQENVGAAAANIAGLNVRPTYDLSYAPVAGQTYVKALQDQGAPKEQVQADTQFYDLLGTLSKAKKDAMNKAVADLGKKDMAKAQKDISAYNTKLMQTLQPWAKAGGTQYLDSVMLAQLRTASITMGGASRTARTQIKYNPTAYDLPETASSLYQQAGKNVVPATNNG